MRDILKLHLANLERHLAKLERIRRQGIWRFVFVRGVLAWGLPMTIFGIIFEHASRKEEAFAWYLIAGLCLVAGFFWGLAVWFLMMRSYSRALKSSPLFKS